MTSDEFGYIATYQQNILQKLFATHFGKYFEFDIKKNANGNQLQFIVANNNDIGETTEPKEQESIIIALIL